MCELWSSQFSIVGLNFFHSQSKILLRVFILHLIYAVIYLEKSLSTSK